MTKYTPCTDEKCRSTQNLYHIRLFYVAHFITLCLIIATLGYLYQVTTELRLYHDGELIERERRNAHYQGENQGFGITILKFQITVHSIVQMSMK